MATKPVQIKPFKYKLEETQPPYSPNGVVERRGSEDGGESGAKVDGAGGRSRRHTTRRQVTSKFLTSCEPWLGI
uniref:Uncharacterized protein n=1 Tax=Oryza rufipogon TaxID=4529 RepID=A0A0E0R7E3_ORYRU